jgi:hypothetical protein
MLILSSRHLQAVLVAYAKHYNGHRLHRSREQQAPDTEALPVRTVIDIDAQRIRRHRILGSLINEHEAALPADRIFERDRSAQRVAAGHAFVQNTRRGHCELATDEPAHHRLPIAFAELASCI